MISADDENYLDLKTARAELAAVEQKLAVQRARYVGICRSIEHSRHGVYVLTPDRYGDRKVERGNVHAEIQELESERYDAESHYSGLLFREWRWNELVEKPPQEVSVRKLWQLWRRVVAARQAVVALGPRVPLHCPDIFSNSTDNAAHASAALAEKVSSRQWVEAFNARDRAECIYDQALRVFEGRREWDYELHGGDRVRKPRYPEPRKRRTVLVDGIRTPLEM
jgi:hypothetical protein